MNPLLLSKSSLNSSMKTHQIENKIDNDISASIYMKIKENLFSPFPCSLCCMRI